MKLSDKIIGLRKSNGMSQEDLAEKLDVQDILISMSHDEVARRFGYEEHTRKAKGALTSKARGKET